MTFSLYPPLVQGAVARGVVRVGGLVPPLPALLRGEAGVVPRSRLRLGVGLQLADLLAGPEVLVHLPVPVLEVPDVVGNRNRFKAEIPKTEIEPFKKPNFGRNQIFGRNKFIWPKYLLSAKMRSFGQYATNEHSANTVYFGQKNQFGRNKLFLPNTETGK